MNRAFEKELSRALATELDTAAPKTLLRRCRAEHIVKQRSDWRDLLHCQFKLLGWKVWALEAMAALALYSVGRELALWEKAWTLRNALFGLSTLAMLTALLGLPFLYRASQYKMLELEQATYAGIGRPLVMRVFAAAGGGNDPAGSAGTQCAGSRAMEHRAIAGGVDRAIPDRKQ